ncbi:MAG: methyltransferase [Bdellovibrionota bacterium]
MFESLDALKFYFATHPETLAGIKTINFCNASAHLLLDELKSKHEVFCMQTFRPLYLQLSSKGYQVDSKLLNSCQLSLICLSKQKEESLSLLGIAAQQTEASGSLLAFGSNDSGAKSFHKKIKKEYGVEVETFSKNKCRIITIKRSDISEKVINQWLSEGDPKPIESRLIATPSSFSSKKIDRGSILLSEFFKEFDFKGPGADFGSGYGYLSWKLLTEGIAPESIDLYEADFNSVTCAQQNLNGFSETSKLKFHWADVLCETPANQFAWIIMNPPFHIANKTQTGLGQKFIQSASKSLRRTGELLMVANRSLPYEEVLDEHFFKHETLCEQDGYKVLKAVK